MTLGYAVTTAVGRVAAGETDELFTPRAPRAGRCGVILCHGAGQLSEFIDLATQKSSMKLAAALATAGIPCIAGDFGGNIWANDVLMSRIDSAWGVLKDAFPTMRTDKVCLLGVSMGGAAVARYSQLHPASVAAVVGFIPVWDLVGLYVANTGGYQAPIGASWGVTPPAPLPATADVATNAPNAAGIPTLAGYSTADQIVKPTWVTSYVAKVGGTAIVTDTVYGHSDQAIGGMPISTVGNFLAAHGA